MDTPPDVYFSWTSCVPQSPWQPSPAFMVFLDKDLCAQREYAPANPEHALTISNRPVTKPNKYGRGNAPQLPTKAKPKTRARVNHKHNEQMYLDLMAEASKVKA